MITSNTVPNNAINNKVSHLSPLRINSNSSSIYNPNNRTAYNRELNLNYNNINNNSLKANGITGNTNHVNGNGVASNGNRRLTNYPSNTSLHNERALNCNSNNGSPVASPSPSHNHNSIGYRAVTPTASPRHTPQREQRSFSASTSNLVSMRKWSASQEFRGNSLEMANKYVSHHPYIPYIYIKVFH